MFSLALHMGAHSIPLPEKVNLRQRFEPPLRPTQPAPFVDYFVNLPPNCRLYNNPDQRPKSTPAAPAK
jgi:hypothetical protein